MNKVLKTVCMTCFAIELALVLLCIASIVYAWSVYDGESAGWGLLGLMGIFVPVLMLVSVASLVCSAFVMRNWQKAESWLKVLTVAAVCVAAGALLLLAPSASYYLQ